MTGSPSLDGSAEYWATVDPPQTVFLLTDCSYALNVPPGESVQIATLIMTASNAPPGDPRVTFSAGLVPGVLGNCSDFSQVQDVGGTESVLLTIIPGACVPAASEWGFVVAGLLLLTAGTLVLKRRRPARA